MPVRRLTLIFEYLTFFSRVQIHTQYGLMLTTLKKFYVLGFLQPIPVFFKCVRSAVHISLTYFHMQHAPAMVSPTYTLTNGTPFQTTLISTSG